MKSWLIPPVLAALSGTLGIPPLAAQGGNEVRLVTLAYARGFKSKADGIKAHLRFNEDEEPTDRPLFLWPLSANNPKWVVVPEFAADLGNQDDVAPNNIIANLRLETSRARPARRLVTLEFGPQWQSARDFSTGLLLAGGGLTFDYFNRVSSEEGLVVALELGLRGDIGPRLARGGGPEPVTFRASPEASVEFERTGSRLHATLSLATRVFAFAGDNLQVDSVIRYTDAVLGVGSVGLELRPRSPDAHNPKRVHNWPVGFVAKYSYGHKPPSFKLLNVLEVGARLYWAPPQP